MSSTLQPSLADPTDLPHHLSVEQVSELLGTSPSEGLTSNEAARRRLDLGPNAVPLRKELPWYRLLIRQLASPLVAVLAVGAALAFLYEDPVNGLAILAVLLLNAAIGFYMDWQARRTIQSLQHLNQHRARVCREGQWLTIPSEEVTVGDLIRVEAGDQVPADARLVSASVLGMDESGLTGESGLVNKGLTVLPEDTQPADRTNMLFTSTIVGRGQATALVTQIGKDTQMGMGLHLMHSITEQESPLEQKLAQLTHRLIYLTVLLATGIIGLGLWRGMELYELLETAIALSVAAIPEGLPVVATITLAVGMSRLARHRIIVKELRAVETLGEAQVIITDKTGTLTENELSVVSILPPGVGQAESDDLLRGMVICNTATVNRNGEMTGDPLEIALLSYALEHGYPVVAARNEAVEQVVRPFSSETRTMLTVHRLPPSKGGKPTYLTILKGAPEAVLPRCAGARDADGNRHRLDTAYWLEQTRTGAGRGYKTLAIAGRRTETLPSEQEEDSSLEWLGLIWLSDPPRSDVRDAVRHLREAGIRVIMATGDHATTARSIALATGLTDDPDCAVVEGRALDDRLAEADLREVPLVDTPVVARVTPAQKLDLLRAYQQQQYTVAMVGDGVNDAPALRRADIGIAMGEGGTEAAKEAADLILSDNSLSRIVAAVKQGRGIFNNIRLFTIYLLSCNLAEILVIGGAFVLRVPGVLVPVQILFLNLLTDVFPALAIGFTGAGEEIMRRPPRSRNEAILPTASWYLIGAYAVVIAAFVLGAVILGRLHFGFSTPLLNDLMFYTLLSAQLWHVLSLPDKGVRLITHPIVRNRYLAYAIGLCLLLTVVINLVSPLRTVMALESTVDWRMIGLALGFGLAPVVVWRTLGRLISHRSSFPAGGSATH